MIITRLFLQTHMHVLGSHIIFLINPYVPYRTRMGYPIAMRIPVAKPAIPIRVWQPIRVRVVRFGPYAYGQIAIRVRYGTRILPYLIMYS